MKRTEGDSRVCISSWESTALRYNDTCHCVCTSHSLLYAVCGFQGENFAQAVEDLTKYVDLVQSKPISFDVLPNALPCVAFCESDDRQLAEAHFSLARALQWAKQLPLAVQHYQTAQDIINVQHTHTHTLSLSLSITLFLSPSSLSLCLSLCFFLPPLSLSITLFLSPSSLSLSITLFFFPLSLVSLVSVVLIPCIILESHFKTLCVDL